MRPALALRFWKKTTDAPGSECWLWTGRLSREGYGRFRLAIRGHLLTLAAQRYAYAITHRGCPPDQALDHIICHNNDTACPGGPSCPHRRCVRPNHLMLSTVQANTRRGRVPHVLRAAGYAPTQPDHLRAGAVCTQPECSKPELAAGLCSTHYFRWWRAQRMAAGLKYRYPARSELVAG